MKTLLGADEIAARVEALGREIRESYGDETITAIAVLKGSFMFLADLVRAIGGDVRVEFLGVSSYSGTESTGQVAITHDLRSSIEGQHVLVVEDIVDTGLTLEFLLRSLDVRAPASLKVATLLDKPSRRVKQVEADFVGFTIPNIFVVGYGLDVDERYRNLPFIGQMTD